MSGTSTVDPAIGPASDPPPQPLTPLHRRVRTIAAGRSYRELGEITRTHPETVRRYLQGHAPSIEFLTRLASSLRVNPAWLLTGEGAMHSADVRSHALRDANPTELLSAVAFTLERLAERIGRMETLLLTLESRLRDHAAAHAERRALALDIAGYAPSAPARSHPIDAPAGDLPPAGDHAGVLAANTPADGIATPQSNEPGARAAREQGDAPAPGGRSPGIDWIAHGVSRGPRADAGGGAAPGGG